MKVLVTGGAGFIGSHLVDALVARGDRVVVLDDLSTGKRENLAQVADRVELRVGSVADKATVDAAARGCERVYHLAAIASVPRTVEAPVETSAVNLQGSLHVLEAARAAGAGRAVFASSAAVYGDRPTGAAHEDADPCPQTPYAVEKLAAEHYFRVWPGLFGLDTVALRFFNIYGPRQDPGSPYSGVISIFVDRLLRGAQPTIFGDGEQTRDFVAVADVVQALLKAGDVPTGGGAVCNVAGGRSVSLNTLYATLAELTGGPAAPNYGEARAGDIRHSLGSADRAREVLGFGAGVSLRDGLARLVDWARSERDQVSGA